MNQLNLNWEPITLNLHTTFRIAHGASDQRHNVLVHLAEGVGEAAAVSYHGETQSGIMAYLRQVSHSHWDDPALIDEILSSLPPGSRAARAGIDIALHDLYGKRLGQPLYKILGLNPTKIPLTSFTIAIDEPERMAEKARTLGYSVIKIKLGTQNDLAILSAIRSVYKARLRLDINAGWSREQALSLIPQILDFDVELIEQPLPVGDIEGLKWLKDKLQQMGIRIPIFADENIKTTEDVLKHVGCVDGIVVKLMKSAGIREAIKEITIAKALGMQIMIGCMVETSVGVTAAAHLAPLCDYVDLDGPLLIKNDPYRGIQYQNSQIILPREPGLGVIIKCQE